MIVKLAQRARCLPALILLAALLITSCTVPLPQRRLSPTQAAQTPAPASRAGGAVETATPLVISAATTVTATLQSTSTLMVAVTPTASAIITDTPAPKVTTTAASPVVSITGTAPITSKATAVALASPPARQPTRTRVVPLAQTTITATKQAALSASPTTIAPATKAPAATPRVVVTSVLTQEVEATAPITVVTLSTPTESAQIAEPTAPIIVVTLPTPTESAQIAEPTPTEAPSPLVEPTPIQAAPLAAPTSATPEPLPLQTITYKTGDILKNGDFEGGFDATGVGDGWKGFGQVSGTYGWSDETYPTLVFDGQNAQMMRVRFTQYPNVYIGIYQTVQVVKGKPYDLVMHGLIRSTEGSPEESAWGYRIQWGIDPKGSGNWKAVQQWVDVGWDDQPIDAPNTMNNYETTIVPSGNTMTLFVRAWRKWSVPTSEGEFLVDGLHLTGPIAVKVTAARLPGTGEDFEDLPW